MIRKLTCKLKFPRAGSGDMQLDEYLRYRIGNSRYCVVHGCPVVWYVTVEDRLACALTLQNPTASSEFA